ncbi:hypothetical protein FHW67_001549 [Herbaspirillum sp. Sphag1AN]|uniref:cytochrome P450 n=1 Tax=unclassified Herbaspirillum TaxID=2624150 RepID=UPI0016116BC9|nr:MULTISPECIES: cytochrome P450 [unclassified Herbaspirillum]MBB3212269.1 hypothetical protein [Herbaspirillum sp. Sphag1AN]MBB3245633.1 hypothetical protein [Herbaspirillum sp. Sphag64]
MRADGSPGDLYWSKDFCGGAWILRDYDSVATALRDPRFSVRRATRWINSSAGLSAQSNEQRQQLQPFKRLLSRSLLFLDGRAHQRLRRAMQAGFHAGALQQQRPRIAAIIAQLLQGLVQRYGQQITDSETQIEFDFIAEVARPLPALVIADLLGIDVSAEQDDHHFIDAAAAIAAFIGSPTPTLDQAEAAQEALLEMASYLEQVIADRQHHPSLTPTDLIGHLMVAAQQGHLSSLELVAQCCTLLFAGYETTRHLLGNGLLALLQHPAQWQALCTEPEQLPSALRELLRYDSPVQYTGRRLTEDLILHGQSLQRGDLVILHLGAANRDPQRFSAPDQLDIHRHEGPHLAFGSGPHVCIGAALTALEAELTLRAVMRMMPDVKLATPAQPPEWQDHAAYRGLQKLPLQASLSPEAINLMKT